MVIAAGPGRLRREGFNSQGQRRECSKAKETFVELEAWEDAQAEKFDVCGGRGR
jgi:hypothetical protein